MNRHGNLWPQIVSFENLLAASRQAQRSKRYRDNVLEFNDRLEPNLLQLQAQLRDHTYRPGAYRIFEIFEPKPRIISAAPYRDRVVHHALCAIIAPIFDRTFIADSYANRKGYGSHRALRRFTAFCRTNPYILSCDIRKYFPSIDQTILKSLIRRKIKCSSTLWLIDSIIDNSHYEDTLLSFFRKIYSGTGRSKMVRGGCWNNNPQNCRSAYRNNNNPDNQNNNIGFRVVCEAASTLPIVRASRSKDRPGAHEESRLVPVVQATVPKNKNELGSLVASANSCPIHPNFR